MFNSADSISRFHDIRTFEVREYETTERSNKYRESTISTNVSVYVWRRISGEIVF